MTHEPTVFVVDDDPAIREALEALFEATEINFEMFSSGEAFLDAFDADRPGCLLLDLRMPGMDGLEVQKRLIERSASLPVIMLTAFGDVPTVVASMKSGALDFLQKPFDTSQLLRQIRLAIDQDARNRGQRKRQTQLDGLLETLTSREREVLELMVEGVSTKSMAQQLGTSTDTVRNQRSSVLKKMEADSTIELARMVTLLRPKEPSLQQSG